MEVYAVVIKRLIKLLKINVILISILIIFTGCEGIVQLTNHPPTISSLIANPDAIEINHNVIITCVAVDKDGDMLAYKWSSTGGKINGNGSMAAWTAPATAGTCIITCTVSDQWGGKDSKSITLSVSVLNQTGKPAVSIRSFNSVTYYLSELSKYSKRINHDGMEIPYKGIIYKPLYTDLQISRNKETGYGAEIYWENYPYASGYKIYRSVNGEDYKVIFKGIYDCCRCWCYYFDADTKKDNIYFYYVTAYGSDWETTPSEVLIVDTWLPPCSLVSPQNNEIINITNPFFTWNPVGLEDSNYGPIDFGATTLFVIDNANNKSVWQRFFNHDLTVSNVFYNDDNDAKPLISGHTYSWWVEIQGYDEDVNLIAMSYSKYRNFTYRGEQ